jgi:hypothetical protein
VSHVQGEAEANFECFEHLGTTNYISRPPKCLNVPSEQRFDTVREVQVARMPLAQ